MLILPSPICIMQHPPYQHENRHVNSTCKNSSVFNKFLTVLTNISVNVNVAVDTSMNSNTRVCAKVSSGKDSNFLKSF